MLVIFETHGSHLCREELLHRVLFLLTTDRKKSEKSRNAQEQNRCQTRQEEMRRSGIRVEAFLKPRRPADSVEKYEVARLSGQ
jgi:hypothetical protein